MQTGCRAADERRRFLVFPLIEIGFAAAAVYILVCLASPTHRCPDCGGRKVIPARSGFTRCGKCKGKGRAYRPGAHTIHRLAWEHAAPWLRQRLHDAVEQRKEKLNERN
jgi:hypothetical protein